MINFACDTKFDKPNLLLLVRYSSATSSFMLGINSKTISAAISL